MIGSTRPAAKSWLWPMLIVALLVLGAGANVAFMMVAVSDPSSAVEPDYYNKSMHWDATQAERQHSDDLGWSVVIDVSQGDALGRSVIARLRDRRGVSLEGARVEIEAFHNARSAHRLDLKLPESGAAGEYRVVVPPLKPGLWEFRVRAQRGGELFTQTVQQDVGVGR